MQKSPSLNHDLLKERGATKIFCNNINRSLSTKKMVDKVNPEPQCLEQLMQYFSTKLQVF